MRAGAGSFAITGGNLDVVQTDASGKTVVDTKAERLKRLADDLDDLTAKAQADPVFGTMLESFSTALNEPDSEFVRLYQIRDALVKRSGQSVMGKRRSNYRRQIEKFYGQMANDEPVVGGRQPCAREVEIDDGEMAREELHRPPVQRHAPVQRQVVHVVRKEHRDRRPRSENMEGDATAVGHRRVLYDWFGHARIVSRSGRRSACNPQRCSLTQDSSAALGHVDACRVQVFRSGRDENELGVSVARHRLRHACPCRRTGPWA